MAVIEMTIMTDDELAASWESREAPGSAAPIQAVPVAKDWIPSGSHLEGAPVVAANAEALLERLIAKWVGLACRHARVRKIGHHEWVADVVGLDGAWSDASTPQKALRQLPGVVTEWVRMKLADGDTDIPRMEGLTLVIKD